MGDCCSTDAQNTAKLMKEDDLNSPLPVDDSDDELPYGKDDDSTGSSPEPEMSATQEARIKEEWIKAVISSNNKKLSQLYSNYAQDIDFIQINFDNGDNSLHYAVRTNNLKLCKLLIKLNIDIDAQNTLSGNTALHYACKQKNEDIVRLLINNGCNRSIQNKNHKFAKDVLLEEKEGVDKDDEIIPSKDTVLQLLGSAQQLEMGKKSNTWRKFEEQQYGSISRLETGKMESIDEHDNDSTKEDEKETLGKENRNENDNDENKNGNKSTDENDDANEKQGTVALKNGGKNVTKNAKSKRPSVPNPKKAPTMVVLHALTEKTQGLPDLKGWVEKRRDSRPFTYQKRWLIVAKPYLLWTKNERQLDDFDTENQRDEFDGYINITTMESVSPHKSKGKEQRKFEVIGRDGMNGQERKEYTFKCDNQEERNEWVDGLNKYIKYYQQMSQLVNS